MIKLKSGLLEATIAPEIGGSIASFSLETETGTIDLFRRFEGTGKDPKQVLEMACFPLVPYSNRIRNGRFEIGKTQIQLPKIDPQDAFTCHGTGWISPWRITACGNDFVRIELDKDPNLPLQYSAAQDIRLRGDVLEIDLSLTNQGDFAFPVGLGLHPYFPARNEATIYAEMQQEWVLDEDSFPLHIEANKDNISFIRGVNGAFLKPMSAYADWNGSAQIKWHNQSVALEIETYPKLAHFLIWAPDDEDFVCLEPASNAIDGFNLANMGHKNTQSGLLGAGEVRTQKFIFRVGIGG